MCIVDKIVIYEAMLWDFPSLATPHHTGQGRVSVFVLELFIIKQRILWVYCVYGFSLWSLSWGIVRSYKIRGGIFVEIYQSPSSQFPEGDQRTN